MNEETLGLWLSSIESYANFPNMEVFRVTMDFYTSKLFGSETYAG